MSKVRLERIGPCRFKVFIDGHEVTNVCSLDTSKLVRLDGLPELTMTFNPDAFEIGTLDTAPSDKAIVQTTMLDSRTRRFGQP